jgi:hypothetical protein
VISTVTPRLSPFLTRSSRLHSQAPAIKIIGIIMERRGFGSGVFYYYGSRLNIHISVVNALGDAFVFLMLGSLNTSKQMRYPHKNDTRDTSAATRRERQGRMRHETRVRRRAQTRVSPGWLVWCHVCKTQARFAADPCYMQMQTMQTHQEML